MSFLQQTVLINDDCRIDVVISVILGLRYVRHMHSEPQGHIIGNVFYSTLQTFLLLSRFTFFNVIHSVFNVFLHPCNAAFR